MLERSRRVILLIDYDNLQICASRDTPGRDLQLPPVVQLAQRYGTVIMARAYAEWNLSTERLAVYKAGIEPAFAPVLRTESDRAGKSLADTVMVAEGMDMLWTLSPEVLVLATSDKDLIPLVRVAKQRGAFVVVLGSDFTAIPLREMADEHVTYRQLITSTATEAPAGRQPAALPEPTRRRPRERNGRERAASAPATTLTPAPARVEREPAPTPPAVPEPVAPLTAGAPLETDSQAGGRRRRRRGSRRRSDRFGALTEGGAGLDATGEAAEEAEAEAELADQLEAVEDIEDEELEEEEEAELEAEVAAAIEGADILVPPASVTDVARASDATVELEIEPDVIPVEVVPVEPALAEVVEQPAEAAPRERRRRTRRRVSPTDEAAAVAEETPVPVEALDGESVARESPPGHETGPVPAAEAQPAPPPESASANGPGGDASEVPAEPVRKPRRVASASRGRSRRV
jgi:hypothetical protein